jgi:hypothetical protein
MSVIPQDVPAVDPSEPFLTSSELRELLNVSDSTLKAWRARGLPHVGGGATRPRYRLSEVERWLNAGRVGR